MVGRSGLVAALVLLTFAAGALPALAQPQEDRVTYEYAGAAALSGVHDAACEASGVNYGRHEGGTLRLVSEGGTLAIRNTWVNYTRAFGFQTDDGGQMQERILEVPRGPVEMEWGERGIAVAYARSPETLRVSMPRGDVNASAVEYGPTSHVVYWLRHAETGTLALHLGNFHGWARRVLATEPAQVSGDVKILLRAAHVRLPDGSDLQLEPFRNETVLADNVAAGRSTVRFTDALLELSGARWEVAPGAAELVCTTLKGRVTGSFVASDARGEAVVSGSNVAFERQVLSVEGEFEVAEESHAENETGVMRGTMTGQLRSLAFDFGQPVVAKGIPGGPELAAAGLLAIAVALAYKWGASVAAFFARFGPERVLEDETRRTIHELVDREQCLSLGEMATRLGMNRKRVEYHLHVLNRTRKLKIVRERRAGSHWFLAVPAGLATQRERAIIQGFHEAADPKLAYLRSILQAQPRRFGEAVEALAGQFSLSIRGARKVVERAESLGFVQRNREEGGRGGVVQLA